MSDYKIYSRVNKPEFVLPKYEEIPGVGLFLEQVSKYINEYLAPLHEAELTGSMISNYVKKDIIDNPVKKQYGREQIATLIFIAVAKIVLSLEDINELLQLQRQVCDTQTAYNYFREEFPKVLEAVFDNRELAVVPETSESDIANIKRLCRNVSITTAYKIYLDMSFANHRSAEATNK